jgi:hypothetical protein
LGGNDPLNRLAEIIVMTPCRNLLTALCCFVLTQLAPAALDQTEATSLERKYRLELPVRKAVSKDATSDTRAFLADALLDKKAGRLFYAVQQTPTLAVVPAEEKIIGKNDKPANGQFRLVLKVRGWTKRNSAIKRGRSPLRCSAM